MNKLNLLIDLYKVHSPSGKEDGMIQFIKDKLEGMNLNPKIDKWGNIYVVKGQAKNYPCIVAHTDEVFDKRSPKYDVISVKDEIIVGYDDAKKDFHGLGADDKNGIWCALKALEEFDVLKAAFFTSEEVGGVGSANCDINFFRDCRFVIQCDRRGNSDIITEIYMSNLCSRQFLNAVNPKCYGYKETSGMFTDVYNLKTKGLNVSVCNISCGYYNPHTKNEYTKIEDLYKCYNFVCHIIRDCTDVYKHNYEKSYNRSYDYKTGRSYGKNFSYGTKGWDNSWYPKDYYSDLEDLYDDDGIYRSTLSDDVPY